MPYKRYRPVKAAARWTFLTKTRGVELFNMVALFAAALTFSEPTRDIAVLPETYGARVLDFGLLTIASAVGGVVQMGSIFLDDRSKWRYISVLLLAASMVFWSWLATLVYYSADWLESVGVHRQLLYLNVILAVLCGLAAEHIRDEII